MPADNVKIRSELARLRKKVGPPPACEERHCKGPVRMPEAVRLLADACPYPRSEGYAGQQVTVENSWLVEGSYPPPLCEGCPYRNDPKQPIRSLTVVKTYRADDVA